MSTDTATQLSIHARPARRVSTETKSSHKTTELIAYVLAVLGVLLPPRWLTLATSVPRRRGSTSHS